MRKSYLMKSMALVAIAAAAASCNHDAWNERPDTTKQQTQEYANNFRSIVLGGQNMDPRQTWNTATSKSLSLNVALTDSREYKVYAYTCNPGINPQAAYIATTTVSAGGQKSISMSMPSDAKKLYFAVYDTDSRLVALTSIDSSESSLSIGTAESNAPRRATVASPSVAEQGQTFNSFMAESYASAMKLAAKWVEKGWNSSINYDDSRYVVAKPWKDSNWSDRYYQVNASVVESGITAELQETYQQAILAKLPESTNNISKAEQTGYSLTTKGGPVTVTPIYHNSNSNDKVSYYYYQAGTTPDVKSLRKYTLGQLGNDGAMRQSYSLVYVDDSGNASYDFPENYVICFLIANMSNSGSNVSVLTKGAGETEEVYLSYPKAYEYYGDGNYNQEVHTVDGWGYTPVTTPHAAVFSSNNYSFVGFEDWNDMDFNDLVFAVGGTTGGETIKIDVEEDDGQDPSWCYFAFEDLGTSDDFDFNDIVVRVSTPDENGVATVDLCAIGGTLECTVFNGTAQIGQEVHNYGVFGANTSNWVGVPIAQLGTVNVPEGTTVAQLNINIQVKRSDGNIVTVTGPAPGETPFRVCVTGDEQGRWYWAKERINISSAYPKFGAWGANIESYPEWYKEPVAASVMQWRDAE